MNKEIKYGGYSANPNDHESVEGDLAVAMNLIPEDATIKPVLPPSDVLNLQGNTLLAIHATAAFKHYILLDGYGTMSWLDAGYTSSGAGLPHSFAGSVVHKVEPIGNTLVVLADDGLHYFLWKSGQYKYLGQHLPELDLQFYLLKMNRFLDGDSAMLETREEIVIEPGTTMAELNRMDALKEAVIAAANKDYAYNSKKKRFTFPFFVRYGFQMYDENVTMMSAPALMVTSADVPNIVLKGIAIVPSTDPRGGTPYVDTNENRNNHTVISCDSPGYSLCFRVVDESQVGELEDWKDIVTSIRFYVSRQFITYNQDSSLKDIKVTWDRVAGSAPTIKLEENEHLVTDIAENPNFYFLTELKPERLLTDRLDPNSVRADRDLYEPDFSMLTVDFELMNDIIVTRETAVDDYHSHDTIVSEHPFSYNSRLNIANVHRKLFCGFPPCCFWNKPHTGDTLATRCVVAYEKDDGTEVFLESQTKDVVFDNNKTIIWFYYPDERAKRAYFVIGNTYYEIPLKAHNTLKGAYYLYLDNESEQQAVSSVPSRSSNEQRIVSEPNKVYTSEVNNPFFFPLAGINTIGTGNIMGLCAAVRPVSTGQMGYADLYIFADSGIWTAKINEKGTYSNITLATGDVCINPDSITQMETDVLFTTDRGIMLISGSQSQCISDAIDDKGQADAGMSGHVGTMAGLQGLGTVAVGPFREYMRSCSMLYDYEGQRVFVYNRAYSYAYIYSLESHKWGMTQSNIDYTVRAYPAAMAVTRSGHLVNYSEPADVNVVHSMLVTRPLSLELPDVLKTVTDVLQRGLFSKRAGHVKSVLLASNDLLEWRIIQTSTDEDLRGYRGSPYKWFRIALLLDLAPGESITGCSVQFDTKYTNRLR